MERSFGSKYGKWIALTAVVLALVLWFVLSGGVENYRAKYEGYDLSQQIGDIGRSSTYSLYLRAHEGAPDASSDVSIPLVTVDSDGVTAQKDGLLMQSGSSATFAVTVPETGFYNIRLTYRTEAARGVDLERELRINGEVPFDGADTLTFTRLWHDGGEVRQDSQGNDIRPTQVEVFGEQTVCCRDSMGYITEPYRFYFEAGESTVTLIATSEPMLLTALRSPPPKECRITPLMPPRSHRRTAFLLTLPSCWKAKAAPCVPPRRCTRVMTVLPPPPLPATCAGRC